MTKFISFHLILLSIAFISILYLDTNNLSTQFIISISLLFYLYFIHIAFYKTFPRKYYLINLGAVIILLFTYKNLITDFSLIRLIFLALVLGQITFLIFFKHIWQKYRENLTYEFSSTALRKIIEKQFKLDKKLDKLQQQNLELEKQKILMNKIYSQTKIINSTLDFNEMLELSKNILAEIVRLPNFVLCVKDKENSSFVSYISYNITEEMEDYIKYLEEEKIGKLLNEISIYSRIEIKNDINFITRYGRSELSAVNIFPLVIKNEQIGLVLSFEQYRKQFSENLLEHTKIAVPQIAMGLKKALLYRKVEELSQKDGLTKLFLHRVFQKKLEDEFNRAKRYREKLSLIMLDIDHFKNFNDTYGHLIGDRVLVMVAESILTHIKSPTLAARYGGEEFAIICPNFTKNEAFKLAESIRQFIEGNKLIVEKQQVSVTISCGVAQFSQHMKSKEILISYADAALYQAKKEGRNRTKIFSKKS